MDVLKEKDVLAPAPADEDPDDWPCHILEDVVIYSQDGKSLVNLLEAELHGPFLVQGKLEVETQYKSQFLRNPRGQIVEVSSDLFSIGDGPEGVTIWAGGSGVWFEIIPGSSYKQEYENMAAAVKLYYSILDYITEAKQSRKKSLDVDKIFDAYSAKVHDSTLNREDVAELCRIHGIFLLSMMRRPAAAREWKSTPIFKWLNQELPDIIPELNSSSGSRGSKELKESKLLPTESSATLPIRQSQNISQVNESQSDQSGEVSHRKLPARSNAKNVSTMVEQVIDMDVRPRGSRKSGKGAGLRLATPGKHPLSITISDDEDDNMRLRKRRRSIVNVASDEEETPIEVPIDDQSEQDEDGDDAEEEEEEEEVVIHKEEEAEPDEEDLDVEEQLQLSLESVKIPSFEPSGPDGLWTCPKKGCKYFVHGVEDADVQEQIRKHFLKHADNIKIQLARFKTVRQESRPHLPINHLLEKLRRLGEASRLAEEAEEEKIDNKPVPKPIKRKLLA